MVTINVDEFDRRKKGVYKLSFGNRCYIGCTRRSIWRRMKEHEETVNGLLSGSEYDDQYYLNNVATHLSLHPEITEGVVEVLEQFVSRAESGNIFEMEKKWIAIFVREGNCLNYRFYQNWSREEFAVLCMKQEASASACQA